MSQLRELQIQAGASFSGEATTPLSFGNQREALTAARFGVALCDRSHWGLLELKGEDRCRFLHNQTTNNINALSPGQGCDTVFVTSTGRTLDLATAYVGESEILTLVSPNRATFLMQWMDRFIFPMDKIAIRDISQEYAIFTLIGPNSSDLLRQLGLNTLSGQPTASHTQVNLQETALGLATGSGLTLDGYTLILPVAGGDRVWSCLVEAGAVPLGEQAWECLRIQQGRPVPDRELTEDYNPLEAGLWYAISFDKGCYIGQETIARLNTYKGVKQRLWGVQLSFPAEPGTAVTKEGEKVGILTSATATESGPFGLAYVRTKAGGEGSVVEIGEGSGKLVGVPFLRHEYCGV